MRPPGPSPGLCAQIACVLEASAPKPGNVHRFRDFEDTTYIDFVLAAVAIGPAMDRAADNGVGAAVLEAVERTRALIGKNANLGLILLLAPLSAAAARPGPLDRARVREVLAGLKPEDGECVYEAIRRAEPGGLGASPAEDVRRGGPTLPLVEAMALAADRDLVARQYANGFREVFEEALLIFQADIGRGVALETAVMRLHLQLMARFPDSLIARKCGEETAREAATRAARVLERGWPGPSEAEEALRDLDDWLRADGHRRNPGTTADLVGATIFIALRNGEIRLPLA